MGCNNYTIECPKCKAVIEADVDISEHIVDWAEECEECGYKFTQDEVLKIYDDALTDCLSSMIDHAHEMSKDR
jgi:predicted Zn-ribbon and HTH transcriptional regulator